MFFLPDAHTDFIFSIVGEELGLLGVWGVMVLFEHFVVARLSLGIAHLRRLRSPSCLWDCLPVLCANTDKSVRGDGLDFHQRLAASLN